MSKRTEATRRAFLQGLGALTATTGLFAPMKAHARSVERKFIFFFASGGWDSTTILDPHYENNAAIDMDPMTEIASAGRLRWTDGEDRPGARRFFSRWASKTAIINGVNAESVGHDSATQLVMTGTTASSYSDWPTLLAAHSKFEYPLPHVVFSGPSFAGTQGQAVVRAGGGTLLDLIDGSIVGYSDRPAPLPAPPADSMIDSFVFDRVANFASSQKGIARKRADGLLSNMERAMELEGRRFEAGLSDLGNTMLDQAVKASEMMRLGLTRTAMIRIPGGWDSHGDVTVQAPAQDAFFAALDQLMDHLQSTPGKDAAWLIDEVTVVGLSEFGRTPLLNGGGGKDHWPFTSNVVVGAGVRGNRLVGKTDKSLVGQSIDLGTGLPSNSGDGLLAKNVGLGLLKIGGLDPARFLPGVQTLDAIVKEG